MSKIFKFIFPLVLSFSNLNATTWMAIDHSGEIKQKAAYCNVSVTGDLILKVEGSKKQISCLKSFNKNLFNKESFIKEEGVILKKSESNFKADEKIFYLAKKEFELPSYLEKKPSP